MIVLNKIDIFELKKYIGIAFREDKDLFTKWHIVSGTKDDCINDTYDVIVESQNHLNITCYAINQIGYTVLIEDRKILYSFGINIFYRRPGILRAWFTEIINILGSFECYLYPKNKRAINHLLKQGMIISDETEQYTRLIFEICHLED